MLVFFFKQKTAYEVRISDWSSDVCSSDLGLGQPLQDGDLAALREVGLVARLLDALLDPVLLDRILDVLELDADRAAVGLVEDGDDFAQARHLDRKSVV